MSTQTANPQTQALIDALDLKSGDDPVNAMRQADAAGRELIRLVLGKLSNRDDLKIVQKEIVERRLRAEMKMRAEKQERQAGRTLTEWLEVRDKKKK